MIYFLSMRFGGNLIKFSIIEVSMKKICRSWVIASLITIFTLPPLYSQTLENLNRGYIAEVQANFQMFSHKFGLVTTIDSLLDCSSSDRIETALIGLNEVPLWVVEMWAKNVPDAEEVSISRYRMALDPKNADSRTDFYRFRSYNMREQVVEALLQDGPKDKKAVLICTFVNGDPSGQFKGLANVLEDLLGVIEEGQITGKLFKFEDVPHKVADLWVKYNHSSCDTKDVSVENFVANHSGGDDIYWRLSYRNSSGGLEQTILIFNGNLVYNNINGQIDAD